MALPTLSIAVADYPKGKSETATKVVIYGTLTIGSGGLYQTNGLPLAFGGAEFAPISPDNLNPAVWAVFISANTGFEYAYDPVHKTLRIYQTGAALSGPLAELASAASVTADTVQFEAVFNKS